MAVKTINIDNGDIKGSPYINKEARLAKITILSKIHSVKYDAFSDNMEVEKNGKEYYLPKNDLKYTITFLNYNTKYKVFKYKKEQENIAGFFVILHEFENTYLLKKEKIILIDAIKPKTGYDTYKAPKLKRLKDVFYVCFKNNQTIELPKKKKDFIKLFSSKSKQIASFMKAHKLNHKKEKDLIQIFKNYTSLL